MARQNILCTPSVLLRHMDFKTVFVHIKRFKKRKPLDMVPMWMSDKKMAAGNIIQVFLDVVPKISDPGTTIENQHFLIAGRMDLNAGCIPSEFHILHIGTWSRAPDTPEF